MTLTLTIPLTKNSWSSNKKKITDCVYNFRKATRIPVEKEMESSVTDLVVPAEKQGKYEKAFVEGPTNSQLEPGKYIN